MPKAEAGTPKALANKMKAKGLQRLRWYCQVCERQMRDENGFKQHTMSEGHVRNMQLVGDNAKSYIDDFSNQFRRDFVQLLRTSHGEKYVHINHFYQEYISNKSHIHMNATRWPSLTLFAQYLGREKICRVKEEEKGLFISWIDDSPEALRRNEAIQKRERQDRGDEEREQRLLRQQIERAQARAKELEERKESQLVMAVEEDREPEIEARQVEPIKIGFGLTKEESNGTVRLTDEDSGVSRLNEEVVAPLSTLSPAPVKLSFSVVKNSNVFARDKKNPLKTKRPVMEEAPKKMSEAERIMKEEIESKRKISERDGIVREKKRIKY